MPSRCLNRVTLIGNLTRDPELRYTPGGMAVVSFGIATNRAWTTKQGERKEDAQFHRIVAWNKLAELCSQLLSKGRRAYVDGRIQYREFTDAENNKKQITEIVIDDMIILDNKGSANRTDNNNVSNNNVNNNVDLENGSVDLAANTNVNGGIEDIVIPDEIEIPSEDKKEETPKKEVSTETKTEEVVKEEVKKEKGEEMPF
jgi:single-strand DNA-binding protein